MIFALIMDKVTVLEGEVFQDYRGKINSLNKFHFEGVKRTYLIYHPDVSVIRGWHAHQHERKWFYCVRGKFSVALVKIDNWQNPNPSLEAEIHHLEEGVSRLVCVPAGYANCLKAHTPDAIMLVLSDKTLEEAANDSWRYDKSMWVDWSKL